MKKILILLLLVAFVVLAALLFWRFYPRLAALPQGPRTPVQNAAEEAPTLHVGSVDIPLTSSFTGSYQDDYVKITVSLADPGAGNVDAMAKFADETLAGYAESFDSTKFTADQKRQMGLSAAGKYTLDLKGERSTGLGGNWSYRLEANSYTGGAHGSYAVTARSYDADGNQLTLADVTGLSSPLPAIAAAAKPRLEKAIADTVAQNGGDAYVPDEDFEGGTDPNADNYANWYLDDDTLVIIFNQYQVGAYALGEYEVPIPLSSLRTSSS